MKALGKGSVASIVKVALTIAWYVMWVLLVAVVIAAVLFGGGLSLVGLGNQGAVPWTISVPALLIGIVVLGGGLIIVWRLRKLFDSFTSGEPFRRENATHLRVIWITMAAIELIRYALVAMTGLLIPQWPDSLRAEFKPEDSFDLTNWMAIAVLIVLAEVFREGARLKEEQELTI